MKLILPIILIKTQFYNSFSSKVLSANTKISIFNWFSKYPTFNNKLSQNVAFYCIVTPLLSAPQHFSTRVTGIISENQSTSIFFLYTIIALFFYIDSLDTCASLLLWLTNEAKVLILRYTVLDLEIYCSNSRITQIETHSKGC